MKKRSEVAAIVLLCITFASFPALLHGWDLWWPQGFPEGAVKGTVHLGEDDDWQFVGVKREEDLWSAGHAAWGEGPYEVIGIIHPDPNVNPVIVRWMNQNNVGWAITRYRDSKTGMINFWVTRANGWNTLKDGTYSTLYYDGAS